MPSAPIKPQSSNKGVAKSQVVLFVDDEPDILDLAGDVLGRELTNCKILRASSVAEARRLIDREKSRLTLVVADLQLPDGRGSELIQDVRKKSPAAGVVMVSGKADLAESVSAFRSGAVDFIPKPFTAEQLVERVRRAIVHQDAVNKTQRRLVRLKSAVKKLNNARHMVSKKVDLLCNDLIGAYGELARQFEDVRIAEDFRKTINVSRDLEQMLCHAMDWVLRKSGYTNIAIYLAGDDSSFELGAYMKYTIPGSKPLTDALKEGIVEQASRENFVSYAEPEIADHLTPTEMDHVKGNGVMAINAAYLGESLAVIVMFREAKTPFTQDDAAMLRSIAPIFANMLTTLAKTGPDHSKDHGVDEDDDEDDMNELGEDVSNEFDSMLDDLFNPDFKGDKNKPGDKQGSNKPKKPDPADWWKTGEDSPF